MGRVEAVGPARVNKVIGQIQTQDGYQPLMITLTLQGPTGHVCWYLLNKVLYLRVYTRTQRVSNLSMTTKLDTQN